MALRKRKSEMWMSHNKVLNGHGKKPHARNPNFETEETKLLISLWGDPKIQKTLITTHKKHPVIAKLADRMRDYGYHRSAEEINTRLKNLKCFYNRIKKDIELGVVIEPTWKHFPAMDEILSREMFGPKQQAPPVASAAMMEQLAKLEEDDSRELRPEDLLSVEEAKVGVDVSGANLLVPKDEPLDDDVDDLDDADMDDFLDGQPIHGFDSPESDSPRSVAECVPPFSAVPKNPKPTYTVAAASSVPFAPIAPAPPKPMIVTNTTNPTSGASKISLVPTNILLKPQPAAQNKINLNRTPSHSFLYTKMPNRTPVSGTHTVTSGTSTAGMPMKVLLVNTMPKSTADTQTCKTVTITKTTAATTLPKISFQQSHPRPSTWRGYTRPTNGNNGFRTLLTQLVSLQTQNLAATRERLDLERQRFEFERSIGERILSVLPMFQQINNNGCPPSTPNVVGPDSSSTPANSSGLSTPKIEIDDKPIE